MSINSSVINSAPINGASGTNNYLAAIESSKDLFTSDGEHVYFGLLVVQESTINDSATCSGSVLVTGNGAIREQIADKLYARDYPAINANLYIVHDTTTANADTGYRTFDYIVYSAVEPVNSSGLLPLWSQTAFTSVLYWYKDLDTKSDTWHPYNIASIQADSYFSDTSALEVISDLVIRENSKDTFSAEGIASFIDIDKAMLIFEDGSIPLSKLQGYTTSFGPGNVVIELRDYVTDLPISSGTIYINGTQYSVNSSTGRTSIGYRSTGTYTFKATSPGYQDTDLDTLNNDSFTI